MYELIAFIKVGLHICGNIRSHQGLTPAAIGHIDENRENRALNGRTIDAEWCHSSQSTFLDVADLERGFPASGGEGRPRDDRRLAVDDDRCVVGWAIVEDLGDVD